MKKLLIVVDMQKDFISGVLGTQQAQEIIPAVLARIENAKEQGETIVFTRDTHEENYLSTQEGKNLPVVHCVKGTDGWQIDERIYSDGFKIFDKGTFGSIDLAKYVYDGAFDSVELIGVCTDICVISNAMLIKAFCPEISVSVRSNCCAGVTPDSHNNALKAMATCQIKIL